jgi:replication-associated recombination protein RarA
MIPQVIKNSFFTVGIGELGLSYLAKYFNMTYEFNICIDVANGHQESFAEFIKTVRKLYPTAFIMANNTFQAVSTIGYPESRIILSQCAVYLATSAKSNASYMAIGEAQQVVKQTGDLSVPIHLRNAPTKLMKELGYGEEYQYSHSYENNFSEQEYLPDEIKNTAFYKPGNNARENELRNFLKNRWKDKYGY